jgi:hypothetical protein
MSFSFAGSANAADPPGPAGLGFASQVAPPHAILRPAVRMRVAHNSSCREIVERNDSVQSPYQYTTNCFLADRFGTRLII